MFGGSDEDEKREWQGGHGGEFVRYYNRYWFEVVPFTLLREDGSDV
jgi:hypothetical protein